MSCHLNIDSTIHKDIRSSLNKFIESNKIPNIIFHGPNGSGKRILVDYFINNIYKNNNDDIKQYVIYVDCAKCNGIKYVREDLKFFAKSQIHHSSNNSKESVFKTIIMFNSDKLTFDAQSALRRCIEVYNHSTRFLIVVENKYKLLRPILSRFCELYVPLPKIDNISVNLNGYNVSSKKYISQNDSQKKLHDELDKVSKTTENIEKKASRLYELGYSAIDIMKYIENKPIDDMYKWTLLLVFQTIKSEFRSEKLLMFFLLHKLYFRLDSDLENILTM